MAEFELNTDITTDTPTIEVTLNPDNPLSLGPHVFQLVVRDNSGNTSEAVRVVVTVVDVDAPIAVLKAPESTNFGRSFTLDGRESHDAGGGEVVQWIWTYLGPAVR